MNTKTDSIRQKRLRAFFFMLLLTCMACVLAEAQRQEHVVDGWRPLHYDVALTLDDRLNELTAAHTNISILILKDSLDVLDLDFGELPVDAVEVDSKPARYERPPGKLLIRLNAPAAKGTRLSVAVSYHGRPKDGLALTPDKDGRPTATGDNWPDRVHHWIPCLDHPSAKATVNFTVTAPAREKVVANGSFLGAGKSSKTDASITWKYRESVPIPPYCMVIFVSESALLKPLRPAVTPLSYYVPQSNRDFAVQGFAPAAFTLDFYNARVAPYPYEKLALIVGPTRFGGMENSSAIVFASTLFDARAEQEPTSRRFHIRQGIESVIAHEIAHQWFGDSVTEQTWSDLWLSEGFATYFAALFLEQYEGESVFRDYMRGDAQAYLRYEETTRTPIYDTETTDLFKLLNKNNYEKGAWVLHMLRRQLGDAAFFRGIRDYYQSHRNSNATTEDLRAALEKSSGVDLKEFFARWVYAAGHPRYELTWTWRANGTRNGQLNLALRQLQTDAPFQDPLPLEIVTAKGAQRVTLHPKSKETQMSVPLGQPPSELRVDPDETLLKEVTVREAN